MAISNIVASGSGYLHVAPTGSYTAAEYTPLTHTIGPFMHYKRNTQPLKTNSDSILDIFRRSQRLLILAVVGTFCYAFVKQSKSHLTLPSFHF